MKIKMQQPVQIHTE